MSASSDRYGFFLQTDYHWGNTTSAAASALPVKAPIFPPPMSWTGIYVGGHLGGGFSNDSWSDPFGSTTVDGFTNFAGFGDKISARGPLAGGQVGLNWQTGRWLLGLEGAGSWLDIRGDATCFSGLGGVNCQRTVNALGTLTGRVGFAWDRSLIYAKAGAAWTNSTHEIFGNTIGNSFGNTTSRRCIPMSALGHKRTSRCVNSMSALPPKDGVIGRRCCG